MENKDKAILICLPVAGSKTKVLVPGSTKDKCGFCQKEVWVSPASRTLAEQHQAIPACMPCAMKQVKKDGRGKFEPLSKGQKQEVADEELRRSGQTN